MEFEYDECFDEFEFNFSFEEAELIRQKSEELRKLCYRFKFFDFDAIADNISPDEKDFDDKERDFFNDLGEILPFVKENKKKLFEHKLFLQLLHDIGSNMSDVKVSVLDSPLDKDDIHEELTSSDDFDSFEIVDAFFKICDRETVCRVYDYLKEEADKVYEDED